MVSTLKYTLPIFLVGITAPGGSIGNMYGLMLARHELYPEVKKSGLCAIKEPLVIFTSEDSHYSVGELDLLFTWNESKEHVPCYAKEQVQKSIS